MNLFFWTSKILWLLFSPDSFLILLLMAAVASLWIKKYKQAAFFLNLLLFVFLMIAVCPVGGWLNYPLEKRFSANPPLPDPVHGIIVLGGAEDIGKSAAWHQTELNRSAERFFAFIRLVRIYPKARHVFSGGTGSLSSQDQKGAAIAGKLFKDQGLDISRILFESQSRNTYENALFTLKLAAPGPGENWILITSAAHMPRSVGVFNKVGWTVIPYPVDHQTNPKGLFHLSWNFSGHLKEFKSALKEWVGLAAYYLTGKTDTLLPGPESSPLSILFNSYSSGV